MNALEHIDRSVKVAVPHGIHGDQDHPCYLATVPPGEPRRDVLRLLTLRRRRLILTWFRRVSWPFESRWGRYQILRPSLAEPQRRAPSFSATFFRADPYSALQLLRTVLPAKESTNAFMRRPALAP